ncbi:MAG TPA: hypothetical protein VGI10_09670 [Polyangiaceae bacterium]
MKASATGLCGIVLCTALGCSSSSTGSGVTSAGGVANAAGSQGQAGSPMLVGGSGGLAGGGSGGTVANAGTSGATSGGSAGYIGDWSAYGCQDEKVHLVGTLNGAALDITHDVGFVGTGLPAAQVEFGVTGSGDQAYVDVTWPMDPPQGVPSPLASMRVQFEAPDPVPGIELCADGAATGLRETNRVGAIAARLVELKCPGTPVAGSIDVDASTLSGTVDGMTISAAVQYNDANGNGQGTQWVYAANGAYVLWLTTDDQAGMATSGQITGGRLEISPPEGSDIYCVGTASFTRAMSAATIHLAGLSKIGSCQTAPSIGSLTYCAQSKLLVLN